MPKPRRAMTRSVLAVAKAALTTAQRALPPYSHPCSPKKFTQHQLFAILVVRRFLGRDYRSVIQLLADWSDLRDLLGLKKEKLPNFSTLCYAEPRLLKKSDWKDSWMKPSARVADAA